MDGDKSVPSELCFANVTDTIRQIHAFHTYVDGRQFLSFKNLRADVLQRLLDCIQYVPPQKLQIIARDVAQIDF